MPSEWEAVQEIIDRLNYHVGTGKLIAGYKWEPVPTKESEGKRDLPSLRMFPPSINEEMIDNCDGRSQIELPFTLSTKREDGIVAHIQAFSKVKNAIDTGTDDVVLTDLGLTANDPIQFRSVNPAVDELSITTEFTVTFLTRRFVRGSRG